MRFIFAITTAIAALISTSASVNARFQVNLPLHKIHDVGTAELADRVGALVSHFNVRSTATEAQLLSELRSMYPIAPSVESSVSVESSARDSLYNSSLPVVFTHGMGDSCFNQGMASLPTLASSFLNTYAVCIPGGSNVLADTLSAFLTTMDANVDIFAKAVANDPKLANGFYAVGLSQGNLVLRGYMHKYNKPRIVRVLHVHGTLLGVSAFPRCPNSISLCQAISSLLGDLAYNSLVQGILFQANYFRSPVALNTSAYRQYSEIASWNGEGVSGVNPVYKSNFLQTQQLTMIKALADTVIDPKDSEWWGEYEQGSYTNVKKMQDTEWYINDTFGLKTLDLGGRLAFNTSTGDHLQFSGAELEAWMLQAGFAN